MLLVGTSNGLQDLESGAAFLDGMAVTALAPCADGQCCALVDQRSVVLIDQVSAEIVPVGELPEPDGQSVAVLPDGMVVVGRRGARLATFGRHGLAQDVPAFSQLPGREHWKNPAGPTPDTRTMATGPARWWVNVHVGGLWWSGDAGETWNAAVEPQADIHEVRAVGQRRLAVAAAIGFGWSEDNGESWSWTTEGLHAEYLRAVALDEENAYVSASDGPFTASGAVYRARLGSGFVRCEAGLPHSFAGNVDSCHLDAAGGRVAFGFGHELYLSEDEGQSWRTAAALPGRISVVRFSLA